MEFIDQTKDGKQGNCMSACIASLMGITIDDVPNFFEISNNDKEWWIELRKWLATHHFGIMTINFEQGWAERFNGYLIVSGISQRDIFHATIWKNGKMVHDPHSSKSGIKKPEQIDIIYCLDPSKYTYKVKSNA